MLTDKLKGENEMANKNEGQEQENERTIDLETWIEIFPDDYYAYLYKAKQQIAEEEKIASMVDNGNAKKIVDDGRGM